MDVRYLPDDLRQSALDVWARVEHPDGEPWIRWREDPGVVQLDGTFTQAELLALLRIMEMAQDEQRGEG